MIVASHRPVATLPAEHPLRATVRELAGRYCEDLKLTPLSSSEVAEYLAIESTKQTHRTVPRLNARLPQSTTAPKAPTLHGGRGGFVAASL